MLYVQKFSTLPIMNELIAYITDNYPFVEEKYPELKDATEQGRLKFAIRHLALHFSKTAGKIAAVSEDADHGKRIDIEKIKEDIPKSLVNTLRLAELVGMTEEKIIKEIKAKYNT